MHHVFLLIRDQSCISEDQKYQGSTYRAPKQKGQKNAKPAPAPATTNEPPAETTSTEKAMDDLVQIGNGVKQVEPIPVTNSEPADDKKERLAKEKQFKKEKKEAEKASKKRKAKDSEAVIEDLEKVQEDTAVVESKDDAVAAPIPVASDTTDLTAHQKKRQKKKEKNQKTADATKTTEPEVPVKETTNADVVMADVPEVAAPAQSATETTAETTAVNGTETSPEKKKQRGLKKSKKNQKKESNAEMDDKAVKETKKSDKEAAVADPAVAVKDKKEKQSKDKESKKSDSADLIESYFQKNSTESSTSLQVIFAKVAKADKARLLDNITVQKSDDGKLILSFKS